MEVIRTPTIEAQSDIDPRTFIDEARFLYTWPKEREPDEVTMKIESLTSSGLLTIALSEEIEWPVYAKSILFGFANNGERNEERTPQSSEIDQTNILEDKTPPC